MKVGVLGTGTVGQTIASKLVEKGNEVMMGSRSPGNEKSITWARSQGERAKAGTFLDAARFGEIVFNCTLGSGSLEALKLAGSDNLADKILVDVSNPLDFSKGMPPSLFVCNTDSLAEQIQRAFPRSKVVKALNTMNAYLMVEPSRLPGDHNVFMAGNHAEAKGKLADFLSQNFGWKKSNILDLGDITAARGCEALLLPWLRLWGSLKNPNFNFHIAVGPPPPQQG